jgi:hypothetical protein
MDKDRLDKAITDLEAALQGPPGPPNASFSTKAYGRDNPGTASQPQAPNHDAAFAAVLGALKAISAD